MESGARSTIFFRLARLDLLPMHESPRQWLKDRYGGEMSEDDKKIAVANADEEIQQLIEGETL